MAIGGSSTSGVGGHVRAPGSGGADPRRGPRLPPGRPGPRAPWRPARASVSSSWTRTGRERRPVRGGLRPGRAGLQHPAPATGSLRRACGKTLAAPVPRAARGGKPLNILGDHRCTATIEAATGLPWTQEPERPLAGEGRGARGPFGHLRPPARSSRAGSTRSRSTSGGATWRDSAEPCPQPAPMIEAGADRLALGADHPGARGGPDPPHRPRAGPRRCSGCTHYEIVADLFRRALPEGVGLINQTGATADSLERYLKAHPEYDPGSCPASAVPDYRRRRARRTASSAPSGARQWCSRRRAPSSPLAGRGSKGWGGMRRCGMPLSPSDSSPARRGARVSLPPAAFRRDHAGGCVDHRGDAQGGLDARAAGTPVLL